MKKELDFSEFKKSQIDEWNTYLKKELGEKPFDALIWEFAKDLTIDPYFENAEYVLNVVDKKSTGWEIAESFVIRNDKESNAQILQSLQGGVNAIHLIFPEKYDADFDVLFKDVFINYIGISFSGAGLTSETIDHFRTYADSKGFPMNQLQFSTALAQSSTCDYPIIVDASVIQTQGGSAIDQIVYALLKGNEYLQSSSDPNSLTLHFQFATDPSYFVEIAKIRVFRTLWQLIEKAYQLKKETPKVYSVTSAFYQSILDRHTNMLRATTQAMSALIGGSDRLEVVGFEAALGKDTAESRRWGRNIQHLLLEESYFESAAQATKGSYYIENMTLAMAGQAWDLFQNFCTSEIENNSEWTKRLEENKNNQISSIQSGARIMVGLNKYPNKMETTIGEAGTPNRIAASLEIQKEEKA